MYNETVAASKRDKKRFTCPHCENTDRAFMEDNGEKWNSPDLTLLCIKPCDPADNSFDNEPAIGVCGAQWEPNE